MKSHLGCEMLRFISGSGRVLGWLPALSLAITFFAFAGSTASAGDSKRSPSSFDGKLGVEKATYDIGIAGGQYGTDNNGNSVSYIEGDLGLNLYFKDYLAWRNAIFGRFPSGQTNYFGLDSSVRAILNVGDQALGFTAFAGPGVRFPTLGPVAPFVEGGAVFKVAGLALGVGFKSILDSWVKSGVGNDNQIFLIIAGGGAI